MTVRKPRLVICGHGHEAAGSAIILHEDSDGTETVVVNCAQSVVSVTMAAERIFATPPSTTA